MTTIALNITSTSSSFIPSTNATAATIHAAGNSHSIGYVPWWTGDWRYWFYFLSHVIGGAGLSLLLLTMCLPLRRVRRNPVLISMCFSWWLGSFPNLTLLFFTNNVLGSPPSHATCLASAALTMAQTPLNAVCAVMLVYNVWSVLHFTSARSNTGQARTVILVLIPYIVFLICAGVVVTVGVLRPELVARATFYCVVRSNILTIFLGIFGGACCVGAIILEAWIAILLRANKSSKSSKNQPQYDDSKNSSSSSALDLQLAIRVMLFGFYIFAGLALSIVSTFNWTSVIPDLCFSTFSIAVFAIFGSQQDVLRVWKRAFCCCFTRSEQRGRRTASHVRAGSRDSRDGGKMKPGAIGPYSPGGNPNGAYWYHGADKRRQEGMGDLNTLHTHQTTTQTASYSGGPYNSHTDFQFNYESDVGMGLVGNGNGAAANPPNHRTGNKSKDTWWSGEKKKNNGRPGTGGSAKRPGTAGSNFGETSMSWYPDLGYDFHPEGTSHTADYEVEMDIAHASPNAYEVNNQPTEKKKEKEGVRRKSQHANPHTRHSSATVPSEYIGTSPRSPAFIYYDPTSPMSTSETVPCLAPSTSLSPASTSLLSPTSTSPLGAGSSPLALASAAANMGGVIHGNDGIKTATGQDNFSFPMKQPKGASGRPGSANPHAPVINSRLYIEHRPSPSTDTSASITNPSDSAIQLPKGGIRNTIATARKELQHHQHQDSYVAEGGSHYHFRDSDQYSHQFVRDSQQYRDSTDVNGLPAYYLREYSHTHMHSTDYRSSLDSSVGGGARAAIKNGVEPHIEPEYTGAQGPTTLYDSNYPYSYDLSTGMHSSAAGDAPQRHYGYTQHANVSTSHRAVVGYDDHEVYAPAPKSAFDKEHNGFELISGRKRTGGASSPESFLTNPSLMNGRMGHGY